MTAATTKEVYRWVEFGTDWHLKRKGFVDAVVKTHGFDAWSWRTMNDQSVGTYGTAADAKDACERALGITTKVAQEDQPTPAARCNVCGWLLVEETKGGCTAGSCSQRPVPKVQEDQPSVIVPPEPVQPSYREDAEARHASAMASKPQGLCDHRKAAQILSIHLGVKVHPVALWQALELASEEI